MADGSERVNLRRLLLALVGAAAGLAFYYIFDVLDDRMLSSHLHLALASLTACFFGGFLAMAGPIPLRRAFVLAAAVALPVTGLVVLGSLRFVQAGQFFAAPENAIAALILGWLPLPFLMAGATGGAGWRDDAALFTHAWGIVVRYAAAWLFVGVIWLVVFLSDALLQLIGLHVIGDLIDVPMVPFLVTGAMLGLALAVVAELSDYVSPFLVLRFLRLLVPVAAVVVAVFLIGLPFAGLSGLFGRLSVSATLLAISLGMVTLVSTALDRSDEEAVTARTLRIAVEALALMLPAVAGLGAWAVWLRITEHGLTPARIAASVAAGVLVAYGVLYALSVLLRGQWMGRVRRGNRIMALGVIVLAGLWFTPLLNSQAMSARDQVARILDGRTPPAEIDPVALTGLGRAGTAALKTLRAAAATPGHAALRDRLAQGAMPRLPTGAPGRSGSPSLADVTARLAKVMPLRPAGGERLRDAVLSFAAVDQLRDWLEACDRPLPDGQPGCVMVHGALLPGGGEQAIVLTRQRAGDLRITAYGAAGAAALSYLTVTQLPGPAALGRDPVAVLEAVLAGKFSFAPPKINALRLKAGDILVLP